MTQLLFRHIARGWNPYITKPIFASAEKRMKSELASRTIPGNIHPPPTMSSPIRENNNSYTSPPAQMTSHDTKSEKSTSKNVKRHSIES